VHAWRQHDRQWNPTAFLRGRPHKTKDTRLIACGGGVYSGIRSGKLDLCYVAVIHALETNDRMRSPRRDKDNKMLLLLGLVQIAGASLTVLNAGLGQKVNPEQAASARCIVR
jgi:hypothetical protein